MDNKIEVFKENQDPLHHLDAIAIKQIIDFILAKYIPAESFRDAEITLTTNQIFTQIVALYPSGHLNELHLYHALVGAGFKFDNIDGDLKFMWLLKEKNLLN